MRRTKVFILPLVTTGLWLLYLCFRNNERGIYPVLTKLARFHPLGKEVLNKTISIGTSSDSLIVKPIVEKLRVHQDVNIFNASIESNELKLAAMKHECVRFKTTGNMSKICVYPTHKDIYVSGSLIRGGMWESDLVQLTRVILTRNPGMSMFDLGCNIGTFTIYVAKMGRKVVAVDANKMNLMLLSRSLDINNLQQSVTLVWNAVSDVRENVTLESKLAPTNIGGWHVQSMKNASNTNVIRTVYLDDLAHLFGKESVFMKMDIERSEMKALAGGKHFLGSVNVTHLLMEFFQHRKGTSGKQIVDFLSERGYKAFPPNAATKIPLKIAGYSKWPDNVLWIKQ